MSFADQYVAKLAEHIRNRAITKRMDGAVAFYLCKSKGRGDKGYVAAITDRGQRVSVLSPAPMKEARNEFETIKKEDVL